MSTELSPASDFPAEKTQNETPKVYKMKKIEFLGRTKRIILQNGNGPCPLIAICNTLILRSEMNLDTYRFEISQEDLLIRLADTILAAGGDTGNKQQDISDAIDLLPCLANGIIVDIRSRRIDDFVATSKLAIFGVLNIPLYHGWIVSDQDYATANAIGSKTYDELTKALVALAQNGQSSGECSVGSAAATTTAFTASAEHSRLKRGDIEERLELFRTLKLSEMEALGFDTPRDSSSGRESVYENSNEYQMSEDDMLGNSVEAASSCTSTPGSYTSQHSKPDDHFSSTESQHKTDCDVGIKISVGEEVPSKTSITKSSEALDHAQLSSTELGDAKVCDAATEDSTKMNAVHVTSSEAISVVKPDVVSTKTNSSSETTLKSDAVTSVNPELGDETVSDVEAESSSKMTAVNVTSSEAISVAKSNLESVKTDSSYHSGRPQDDDGPLYGDEKSVSLGSPVYEGASLLRKSSSERRHTNGLTPVEGALIKTFLDENSNQLSVTGLFYLREELKEREPCVFFRNNHFLTLLKYDSELYQLVTDQGYLTQQDVVWEKLNDVNGDSVLMTGDFKVFMGDNGQSNIWDQQQALNNAADSICNINRSSTEAVDIDLDNAMAWKLQEQEWDRDADTEPEVPSSDF